LKHIGIINPGAWINIANWVGIPILAIYIFCMFIFPFFVGDWSYVQSIWHYWQSLNVGVLALTSSLIAFNISRFNADNQRARNFVAARAFLPEALSELNVYTESCSPLLKEAWHRANNKTDKCRTPLAESLPKLPSSYKEIFSRCIAFSEPDVGKHLAYILTRLQVNHSRLTSLENEFCKESITTQIPVNIMSYMYSLGELMALLNRTYGFARGQDKFCAKRLDIGDFNTAYFGLDIPSEVSEELSGFTERQVARDFIRPLYDTL
jgi:hypothetical protein